LDLIILLVIGLIFDGVGAVFIVKPILVHYKNFIKREALFNRFKLGDSDLIRRAEALKIEPVEIANRRINNFYQLQTEDFQYQRTEEESSTSNATLGIYFIVIGLMCIAVSNIF